MLKLKKVAIYQKTNSTQNVMKILKFRSQINKLIRYAKVNNKPYNIYIDDGIYDSDNNKLSNLKKLILDIKKGLISEVWIYDVTSLGMNNKSIVKIVNTLRKYNVSIKSKRRIS